MNLADYLTHKETELCAQPPQPPQKESCEFHNQFGKVAVSLFRDKYDLQKAQDAYTPTGMLGFLA